MKRDVLIVGGGVAGIAAAFEFADRGHRVELFEGHKWLGGRAFTPPNRLPDHVIDNGPHVIMGCYLSFRRLLERIDSVDGFEVTDRLELLYADTDGRQSRLRLARGPAPLMMPWALLRFSGMPFGARCRAFLGMAASVFGARRGRTLADWLRRTRQQGDPTRFLWEPLCRAIMNAETDQVEARPFLATLQRAFGGSGRAAAIWIPARPWSELVGDPSLRALEESGVTCHLGRRITGLRRDGDRVTALEWRDGSCDVPEGTLVVLAVPWHAADKLVPGLGGEFVGSPIVSVYFEQAEDPHLPNESLMAMAGGEPFHFLCRRPGDSGHAFAVLAGGGEGLSGHSVEAIAALARTQIRRHFPDATLDDSSPYRVVREARATVLLAPGVDGKRPQPSGVDGLANVAACGDWTAVGLPSTLEGAAESGLRVAALERG